MNACRICGESDRHHQAFQCREKMLGLGDEAVYYQCQACGCLQIGAIPTDMRQYYPAHYYSFKVAAVPTSGWRSRLGAIRDRINLTAPHLIPGFLRERFASRYDLASLGAIPIARSMRILDVGCGNGQLLSFLHRAGFRRLLGIDPFLAKELELAPGLPLRRQHLAEVQGQFEVIMFHHVFEHIAEQEATLRLARERLAPGGTVLIRIPTCECEAWERYRENWVQLDAPRHFFLHTRKSLGIVAGTAGLRIERCWCDSGAFQFWASELYVKGVSLFATNGQPVQVEDYFTPARLAEFEREARRLNAIGRGDQIVALLKDAHSG